MKYEDGKIRVCIALTLLEMVIAMAIMAIVFAVLLPQFRAVLNSWSSKTAAAETLQNARVLIDHINRNLTEAARITAVSNFTETVGFIEFEDNDGDTLRYDVDANSYAQFGSVGNLSELAGPVNRLQFTCYDACDLDTPITDVNDIRFVKVEVTLTNPAAMGRDMTFTAQAYIRTNVSSCTEGLVGWWKLDETSGLTAADSSGQGNDGTLNNMTGSEWTAGPVDGALEFDGSSDYIRVNNSDSLDIGNTFTAALWVNYEGGSIPDNYERMLTKKAAWDSLNGWEISLETGYDTVLTVRGSSGDGYAYPVVSSWAAGGWHHIAVVYEGTTATVYSDGVERDTVTIASVVDNDLPLYIGRYGDGQYCHWSGKIDDVRLYNYALSAEDIIGLAEPWEITDGTHFEHNTTTGMQPALAQIDSTHYLCAYRGPDDDGWAVVLTVDTSDWTISKGTTLEFDTSNGRTPALVKIDSTHYLCAYGGPGGDGWAVVFTVDTGNWTISRETAFEYDDTNGKEPALAKIDDTHYLCAYRGPADDGWAVVLTVDTGNWTISRGTPFEYNNTNGWDPALAKIDSTHYLCAYEGPGSDGWSVVLTVDTGNWTISAGTQLEYDTANGQTAALAEIDDTHYLCAYKGPGNDGWAVVLTVNTGTWTVSRETAFEYDNFRGADPALSQIDKSRCLCAYKGPGGDGWAVMLTVDTDNWTISRNTAFEHNTTDGGNPALAKIDDMHHLCAYQGPADDGWAAVLSVGVTPADENLIPPVGP